MGAGEAGIELDGPPERRDRPPGVLASRVEEPELVVDVEIVVEDRRRLLERGECLLVAIGLEKDPPLELQDVESRDVRPILDRLEGRERRCRIARPVFRLREYQPRVGIVSLDADDPAGEVPRLVEVAELEGDAGEPVQDTRRSRGVTIRVHVPRVGVHEVVPRLEERPLHVGGDGAGVRLRRGGGRGHDDENGDQAGPNAFRVGLFHTSSITRGRCGGKQLMPRPPHRVRAGPGRRTTRGRSR